MCKLCATRLGGWINRKGMAMRFAVPIVWGNPQTTAVTATFA